MIISGFQPLSLLDYPGIISSIVFTQGCPFRCPYCHNPELIPIQPHKTEQTINEATIFTHLQQKKKMIEGVCITGGEPTIHPDLPGFIKKIKRLGLLVKLDTNGVNPVMVEQLIKDHLVDFFAMDVKHVWNHYPDVIGHAQSHVIENCKKTFDLLQKSSVPHEFRTTIYRGFHTLKDVEEIASYLQPGEHYALQQIRYEKTLDPALSQKPLLDITSLLTSLQQKFPALAIETRG